MAKYNARDAIQRGDANPDEHCKAVFPITTRRGTTDARVLLRRARDESGARFCILEEYGGLISKRYDVRIEGTGRQMADFLRVIIAAGG
jgi:hypothetical protein